jgi:hypothetical protein
VNGARFRFALALMLALGRAGLLHAQRNPTLEISLPPAGQLAQAGPLIVARDMLSGTRTREPLAAGFPARFHFTVTLWSEGGLGHQVERLAEYEILVNYVAMEKKYQVMQLVNDHSLSLGKFDRVEDAEGAIARPTRAPIRAFSSKRRLYYRVTLDVEILQLSDLDEVNRWLKGELEPAIHGRRDPGTALTRSIRMLASRLLGGETREFEAQTEAFRVP